MLYMLLTEIAQIPSISDVSFRSWLSYHQTTWQENWKWPCGKPDKPTEGTIYELTPRFLPWWTNWPDDQIYANLPAMSIDQ